MVEYQYCVKWTLHCGTLAMTCFNNGTTLFQTRINTVVLRASLLLNALPLV